MYEKLRRNTINISVFDPDYSLIKKQIRLLNLLSVKDYENILDYGAGNSPYKKLFKFQNYTTADIEQNFNKDIDILIDKKNPFIPCSDNKFDLILCMDVLEHVNDDLITLKELKRVTKKGGIIVIGLPFLYREHEMPNDYRRYTSSGIYELLKHLGLTEIQVVKFGNIFQLCYSLYNEHYIKTYETYKINILQRIIRKLINIILLPLLNLTVFRLRCVQDSSIFSRMFITAIKPE